MAIAETLGATHGLLSFGSFIGRAVEMYTLDREGETIHSRDLKVRQERQESVLTQLRHPQLDTLADHLKQQPLDGTTQPLVPRRAKVFRSKALRGY